MCVCVCLYTYNITCDTYIHGLFMSYLGKLLLPFHYFRNCNVLICE